jgi:hypothetical protein
VLNESEYKEYYGAWAWMREGLRSDTFFARHHLAIMYLKDPVLAGLLVLLHDIPH